MMMIAEPTAPMPDLVAIWRQSHPRHPPATLTSTRTLRSAQVQHLSAASHHMRIKNVPTPELVPCNMCLYPCRMPPYSHADIPFLFPHRNSGGSRQLVG